MPGGENASDSTVKESVGDLWRTLSRFMAYGL